MKLIDWILAILVLFAAALVTVIIINLISLSKFQKCLTVPMSDLPKYCDEILQNQNQN